MTAQPVYDRPATELGQGRWPVEPWVVAAVVALAALVLGLLVWLRIRRAIRARREEAGPPSSRASRRPPPPSQRPGAG